jgi:hypothetical protein
LSDKTVAFYEVLSGENHSSVSRSRGVGEWRNVESACALVLVDLHRDLGGRLLDEVLETLSLVRVYDEFSRLTTQKLVVSRAGGGSDLVVASSDDVHQEVDVALGAKAVIV